MLIQTFEAYRQQNLELTSYGHCYQELIYQSFQQAKILSKEYEKYLNVLTEMAWERYKNNRPLNKVDVNNFFTAYEKEYLKVNRNEILEKLIKNSILCDTELGLDFKYPYIFYFFVGKKIAENFTEYDEVKVVVESLIESLHKQESANILIFITHHTKDTWVLEKIQGILDLQFSDQERATLTIDQLDFMKEFIGQIPELVVEKREVQLVREEHNRRLDDIERRQEDKRDQDEVLESTEVFSSINKTFKGIEIAGQIIRNRNASLKRNNLLGLAASGTDSGLRFLNYFINISDEFKYEIQEYIDSALTENPSLTNSEIQEQAKWTYLHLTYSVVNGIVRKVASSIGSKEAIEVYKTLEEKDSSPSRILINLAIELQYKRELDIDVVTNALAKLKGNVVCIRILKEIVIQHIYMFPVGYKIKQKLSELLEVRIEGLRAMDRRKQIKV